MIPSSQETRSLCTCSNIDINILGLYDCVNHTFLFPCHAGLDVLQHSFLAHNHITWVYNGQYGRDNT